MIPLYWFLGITGAIVGFGAWLVWYIGLVAILAKHARDYPLDYALCGALVASSMLIAFDSNFWKLTRAEIEAMTWIQWAVLCSRPIGAGLTGGSGTPLTGRRVMMARSKSAILANDSDSFV